MTKKPKSKAKKGKKTKKPRESNYYTFVLWLDCPNWKPY